MEYSSFSALDQLDKISQDSSLVFEQVRADISGVVSYGIDSYESLQPSDVEADSFNKANYVKNIHKSGDLIESGTPAIRSHHQKTGLSFFHYQAKMQPFMQTKPLLPLISGTTT